MGNPGRFFKNLGYEFEFLVALGRSYHQGGDIGKLLYIASQVQDGDAEGAFRAFYEAGEAAEKLGQHSADCGHRVSAREAYLWAASYFHTASRFLDASPDPTRLTPTWARHQTCWEKSVALFDPPAEVVAIPYEGTALRGWFFRPSPVAKRRPTLIFNNGSDGPPMTMWTTGGAVARARGYNCLIFDGPGQGYALFRQNLHFRPDWEKVITPVVNFLLTRMDVDAERIGILGMSQAGYWAPRALAFEHRIGAGVIDPGMVDVSTIWVEHLPPELRRLIDNDQKEAIDEALSNAPRDDKAVLDYRMRPFGMSSAFDVFKASLGYNLRGVAHHIRCPVLITDPEDEQFWPGQSRELYELLNCPKTLVQFTAEEGANWHCEPVAEGLRDLRVFDWLDEQFGR
jgi:hypothetical protein